MVSARGGEARGGGGGGGGREGGGERCGGEGGGQRRMEKKVAARGGGKRGLVRGGRACVGLGVADEARVAGSRRCSAAPLVPASPPSPSPLRRNRCGGLSASNGGYQPTGTRPRQHTPAAGHPSPHPASGSLLKHHLPISTPPHPPKPPPQPPHTMATSSPRQRSHVIGAPPMRLVERGGGGRRTGQPAVHGWTLASHRIANDHGGGGGSPHPNYYQPGGAGEGGGRGAADTWRGGEQNPGAAAVVVSAAPG